MTYQDFINRSDYKYIRSNYPGAVYAFTNSTAADIKLTTEHYTRRGARWILTDTDTEYITYEFYINTIGAVPFFRAWGGFERVTTAYTPRGYMPVQVDSISPDRTEKTRRRFEF